MPHTLSDAETSLLLRHLLSHPTDPALVPVIQSLHSSLVTSRTTWDTSLPHLSLSDSDLSLPNPSFLNPPVSDLLDDRYTVDGARLSDALSDPTIPSCNYGDPEVMMHDCGISKDKIHDLEVRKPLLYSYKCVTYLYFQVAENLEQILEESGRSSRTGRRRRKRPRHESPGPVNCQRGGSTDVWASLGAVEDSQALPKPCAVVLASLSSHGSLLAKETSTACAMIIEMRNMLSGESWKEGQTAFQVNSLENIILRCQRVEKVEVSVQFISMVNFIQLAAKIERYFIHSSLYLFRSISLL